MHFYSSLLQLSTIRTLPNRSSRMLITRRGLPGIMRVIWPLSLVRRMLPTMPKVWWLARDRKMLDLALTSMPNRPPISSKMIRLMSSSSHRTICCQT